MKKAVNHYVNYKITRFAKVLFYLLLAVLSLVIAFTADFVLEKNQEDLYRLKNRGAYDQFINYVDGYKLNVDQNMKVDMSYSGVCAVLENQSKRIEIYKQKLTGDESQEAYINYSNYFLSNIADHVKEYEYECIKNKRSVHILQWHRQKLSRIENDRNHYVSIEILSGKRVIYTILVKSTVPFETGEDYEYLIDHFATFIPSKAPIMRVAKVVSVEERGWNQETKDTFQKYFSKDSVLTWGIFEPSAPKDFTKLKHLEASMEYEFPFLLNYTDFENKYKHSNLKSRLERAYDNNKILELTLQTSWTQEGEGNMVYDVLDGEYDRFLKDYAQTVSEFAHPVLFRLGNEMNGDWCPYSSYNTSKDTMIFKEFYRYIHQIFDEEKADNVIWVWNPNGKSFPDFEWNDASMYYPGDQYVDIIGLTAYNTGTYYAGESWTEFDDLYDPLYAKYNKLYRKPMMITEFASSSIGGDKTEWVKNMFAHIKKYKKIKVAIWWNGCDWDINGNVARPYFIDETPDLIQVFKGWLNRSGGFK